jgi:hypothetical protein
MSVLLRSYLFWNGSDYFLILDTASPDDPNEISFSKGEILEIVDKQGKWWQAKKADGSIGSAFPFFHFFCHKF